MSTGGASSTVGGNFQIFEEFAKRSGAILQLGTSVVAIQNTTEFNEYGEPIGRYVVLTDDGEEHVYDAVLLAAPLASTLNCLRREKAMYIDELFAFISTRVELKCHFLPRPMLFVNTTRSMLP